MIDVRLLDERDSLEALTALIHRAYARLGAMGLNYMGVWQPVETTLQRTREGECWLADDDGVVVGTIVVSPPHRSGGCEWYDRPDVATFGQFAVEPARQGAGIGSLLLDHVEARARAMGATELACDTSEQAQHLIDWYAARGYRQVGTVDWRPTTNYRSVVLSKSL